MRVVKAILRRLIRLFAFVTTPLHPILFSISRNQSYRAVLSRFGINEPNTTDEHIVDNIKAFVAQVDPVAVASVVRPKKYAKSIEILIPCYNHGPFLEETFQSIEWQTVIPDNLVVTFINDTSTDNSLEVMKKIQKNSKRIKVRVIDNEKNLNQAGSLNKAIMSSKSQLLINLNADDLLVPDCIEKILQTYEMHHDIFLLGATSLWFETGHKIPKHKIQDIKNLKLTKFGPSDALRFHDPYMINMSQSSCSFFRSAWELVGGYYPRDKRVYSFDDRDFQMRVCSLLPIAVYKDYPLQFYRTDSSQARATI